MSDLHLADGSVESMFHEARQGRSLERLCERILSEPEAELVLLGDIIDLTAMTPPAGVDVFMRAMNLPPRAAASRSTVDLCAATRAHHPRTCAAIAELARKVRVTLVPGNHDRMLTGPEDLAALGWERVTVESSVTRAIADHAS